MLTIGKLGANRGPLQYYERQVAAGLEDYYAGRGEARGVWLGAGTVALGLTSGRQVEAAGFMALMRGMSPSIVGCCGPWVNARRWRPSI